MSRIPERCVALITRKGGDVTLAAPPPAHLSEYRVAGPLFRELDFLGTHFPLLMVEAPPMERWDPAAEPPSGCSLLVPFQDPENVGAVLRSAVAFDAARVVLLEEAAHPYHPRAIRASSGAVFDAALQRGPSLSALPGDLPVIALSAEGAPLRDVAFPERFYLLPGLEGPGLPAAWRERAVSIPLREGVESLNASVATSVALWEWARSR